MGDGFTVIEYIDDPPEQALPPVVVATAIYLTVMGALVVLINV